MTKIAATGAVLYTRNDVFGMRARYLAALKQANIVAVVIDAPSTFLKSINPGDKYPLITDRNLLVHGAPLDAFIEERFPNPSFLPTEPVERAQVRMLADHVVTWYPDLDGDMGRESTLEAIAEVESIYDYERFWLIGDRMTLVDIAVMPLLWYAHRRRWWDPKPSRLRHYFTKLSETPQFTEAAAATPLVFDAVAA